MLPLRVPTTKAESLLVSETGLGKLRYGIENYVSRNPRGRGGGASGRAVAFCLSRPGLIPGTDLLGFFWFRIAANLFSLGAGLFLKE